MHMLNNIGPSTVTKPNLFGHIVVHFGDNFEKCSVSDSYLFSIVTSIVYNWLVHLSRTYSKLCEHLTLKGLKEVQRTQYRRLLLNIEMLQLFCYLRLNKTLFL